MNKLNKAKVDELFQREAVLIGSGDVVPVFRVAVLFGDGAVAHALSLAPGEYSNRYGVGGYTIEYLTLRGFRAAASFFNVQKLREEVPA